jgi:hypothetical protein
MAITPGGVLLFTQEANLDACGFEVSAAMPLLAVDALGDGGAGAAERRPEELLVVAEASELIGYADAADVG